MATAAIAKHHHHQSHREPSRRWRRCRGVIRCSSPAQEFAALAAVFRRRLVVGASTAAAAAVGANFGGVTSFLLGLSPELGRSLRLDVLYPVGGFTRCLDSENGFGTRVEAFPGMLHDLFDRWFKREIAPFKPDFCIVDFFNEGDYSHPHHCPPWYGRPLYTLCLTDCDMVFGRAIYGERGDHRGPLKLSLATGSLLLLQGKSADFAKRAIPATRKQRILLHFGKSVSRKNVPAEGASRYSPPLTPPLMPWGSSSRPGNISHHPASPKPFGYGPASSVLPAPVVGPHPVPPTDGMQPLFVAPAPVAAAAIPFPPSIPLPNTTAAWMPEATPRPAPPRFPGPGTGVFLPPGANHHPLPHQMIPVSHAHAEPISPQGSSAYLHNKSTSAEMANGNLSPKSSTAKKI